MLNASNYYTRSDLMLEQIRPPYRVTIAATVTALSLLLTATDSCVAMQT